MLPQAAREKATAADDIGFGNGIKILLRFARPWWPDAAEDLSDLTFLLSDETIPVWWTRRPSEDPVLTGWFGGPRTAELSGLNPQALIDAGIDSLAAIFRLSRDDLARGLVAAEAVNWAHDPFARGAYSWATPRTRAAQEILSRAPMARCCSPAKRCIAAVTWERSRPRLRAGWRRRRWSCADRKKARCSAGLSSHQRLPPKLNVTPGPPP